MSLPANEAMKAKRLLERLQAGNFDDNDVDSLFMKLREFSTGHAVFREIADFVAHNRARNRGLTNDSVYGTYLSFRYVTEYSLSNNKLTVDHDIPAWIHDLMLMQIERCGQNELKGKFGLSRDRAKKKIGLLYKRDENDRTKCRYTKRNIDDKTFKFLKFILGSIRIHPAYTQEDIIEEFVEVLRTNELLTECSPGDIRNQGDKIMIAVLCLLHKTNFDLKNNIKGTCKISCENLQGYIPQLMPPNFGRLTLNGIIPSQLGSKRFDVSFPVVTTTLDPIEWINKSLYVNKGPSILTLDFDCEWGLDKNFQLMRL
jgi:hypothetical protein